MPVEEILAGGPPRDGIPALDEPKFVSAAASVWEDDEHVVGVSVGGESRAYPLAILVWHELVNDSLGGEPILVSYCPLCGTAMVFDRRVGGRERRFGVSGLLYLSDLLLYDRASESLWSQISATAVTGPLARQAPGSPAFAGRQLGRVARSAPGYDDPDARHRSSARLRRDALRRLLLQ